MIERLARHGCKNITSRLDPDRCSKVYVDRGGFGDVYQGWLFGNVKVAIKYPPLIDSTEHDNEVLKARWFWYNSLSRSQYFTLEPRARVVCIVEMQASKRARADGACYVSRPDVYCITLDGRR